MSAQFRKKKGMESCLKLSDGDILSRLRCEASICEFLPKGKGAGEGPTHCVQDALMFNHLHYASQSENLSIIHDQGWREV